MLVHFSLCLVQIGVPLTGGEDAGDRGDNVRGVLAAPSHLHAGP